MSIQLSQTLNLDDSADDRALTSEESQRETSGELAALLRGAEDAYLASPLADCEQLWAGIEASLERPSR